MTDTDLTQRARDEYGETPGEGTYNDGWRDAMRAAKESVGTYLGYPSANGVMGFGPDAVIVDGDWLKARLDERDAAVPPWPRYGDGSRGWRTSGRPGRSRTGRRCTRAVSSRTTRLDPTTSAPC